MDHPERWPCFYRGGQYVVEDENGFEVTRHPRRRVAVVNALVAARNRNQKVRVTDGKEHVPR